MFQEFLDEALDFSLQPDTNPRYTIKDDNSNIINDNVQIDMKTPVVQNSTPLNRAYISNLQGDLYTQDRYNTPAYSGSAMSLALPLTSYEKNKIVKIVAPISITNPTLNINKLGAKAINGNINAGERYNLIYNGTSFDIDKNLADYITFTDVTELEIDGLNIVDVNDYEFSLMTTSATRIDMIVNDNSNKEYGTVTDTGTEASQDASWLLRSTAYKGTTLFRLGVANDTPFFMANAVGASVNTFSLQAHHHIVGGVLGTPDTLYSKITKLKITFATTTSGSLSIYRR